jgi:hypothetical protein
MPITRKFATPLLGITISAMLSFSCMEQAEKPASVARRAASGDELGKGGKTSSNPNDKDQAGTVADKQPDSSPAIPSAGDLKSGSTEDLNGNITVKGPIGPGCIKWESLKKPSDLACAGSVENVFAQLPDWLGFNIALMKASESTQPATQATPRVILYDPTLNFIVAASSRKGEKTLEAIVFDHDKEEWNVGEISFADPKVPKLEKQSCKTCHGDTFRLIWASYPRWKGAVGIADEFEAFDQSLHQNMTKGDADFLNAAAAKSAEIPAIVKSLTFEPKGYYKAGEIFWTSSKPIGNESQLGINYAISFRSPRTYAGKIMRDGSVTPKQRLDIVKGIFCGKPGAAFQALNATPYKPESFLNHEKTVDGVERIDSGWDAQISEVDILGAELFRRIWEADVALKQQLPELAAMYQDDAYKLFLSRSTADGLTYRIGKEVKLYRPSVLIRDTIKPYLSSVKTCAILDSHN